ncbi:MAG: HDOD domain-containing protein [Pseudomonadota bacterium]
MLTAAQMVDETTTIVSLPETYLRTKQIIDDPDAGITDIACLLNRDPGLTARLLKMANSAYFSLRATVDNTLHAVNILGPRMVHDLVLATSVTRAFSGICSSVMNMDIFWQNSIYCATLSKLLAEKRGAVNSERLFIQGLLYDVGHLVMYQWVSNACQDALLKSKSEDIPLHEVELDLIGTHYAEVGGLLLKSWGLPDSISEPVTHHATPDCEQHYYHDAVVINIASRIISSADVNTPLEDRQVNQDSNISELLNFTDRECTEVLASADQMASEMLTAIFPGHREVA